MIAPSRGSSVAPGIGFKSPSSLKTFVSRLSFPLSTSVRTAAAVIGFEMLAMRKRESGSTRVPVLRSAYP